MLNCRCCWLPLPETRVERALREMGEKFEAKMALADKTLRVRPATLEEWHGIGQLERDDEMPERRHDT
jgi:hypothetical protein